MQRRIWMLVLMALVALPLAACGVKGDPKHPEGSKYPRTYPAK